MVRVLDSGSSGPGLGLGRGRCVVFSQCLSPPMYINGYRRNCWGWGGGGGNPAMD